MSPRASLRRNACPALAAPMATGDGLLARLLPAGAIALDAFSGLCAAARTHGNGVIEITARGSLQMRGLTPASAPAFAGAVGELAIDIADGAQVLVNPLTGRDPDELVDAGSLAAELRKALIPMRLAPKVSVFIDGGGALHLDALSADVRLRADGKSLHIALGGDAARAVPLGAVAPAHAVKALVRLLDVLAHQGLMARARDVIAGQGVDVFREKVAEYLIDAPPPPPRAPAEPVGIHVLHGETVALGIALPFGHSDGGTLAQLVDASRGAGADSVRLAPGRSFLIFGVDRNSVAALSAEAAQLGFIVDPCDPRRRVFACAGAPICFSAEIPARTIAPAVAAAVAAWCGTVHVSGCVKGCAHQGPAALTIIGRDGCCDLMVDGVATGSVAVENLIETITRLTAPKQEAAHG